jgi:hypothetical protein
MSLTLIGFVLIGLIILVVGAIVFSLIGAWVKALFNGAPVPLSKLVALKFASIPYGLIVDARITAVRAGINLALPGRRQRRPHRPGADRRPEGRHRARLGPRVRDRPRDQGLRQERRRGRPHFRRPQGHRLPQS